MLYTNGENSTLTKNCLTLPHVSVSLFWEQEWLREDFQTEALTLIQTTNGKKLVVLFTSPFGYINGLQIGAEVEVSLFVTLIHKG